MDAVADDASADSEPNVGGGADSELLIISPAAIAKQDNGLIIDKKFVAGVQSFTNRWNGPVRVLARQGEHAELPFSAGYAEPALPFRVEFLGGGERITADHLKGAGVILAAGDDPAQYEVAGLAVGLKTPVIFTIENPLMGTMEIIWIERTGFVNILKSSVWAIFSELRRRRAFRCGAGLQANGTPAQAAYRNASPRILPFFDTRMTESIMSTDQEILARSKYREAGSPLRLAFSGRLERIKGADHLLELARHLRDSELPYILNVFGAGTMEGEFRQAESAGLLRYHGAVDFESELVPSLRTGCDIFVSCHRQSDPSCTYLEAWGCGTPILGYDNRAFRGLMQQCNGGWLVRKRSVDFMAQELMRIDQHRREISQKAFAARNFSRTHSFEATFDRRVDDLKNLAKVYTV